MDSVRLDNIGSNSDPEMGDEGRGKAGDEKSAGETGCKSEVGNMAEAQEARGSKEGRFVFRRVLGAEG